MVVSGISCAVLVLGACSSAKPTTAATATAGASASPSASPTAAPAKIAPSTNLDKITVTGAYGQTPKVTVKAPWAINKTQTKVLKASNGPVVGPGQSVEVNYYGVIGRTGKKFDESYSTKKSVAFSLDQVVPGFKKGLIGQHQGSRVLIAMPGSDGYDAAGGSPDAGIEVGDSLIFVVDIVGVQLSGPQGKAVPPVKGLPTVTGPIGKPTLTIPKSNPPGQLRVETLIKGTGQKVAKSDTIVFNYRWVTWKDNRLLEETYSSKKPANTALSGLLPGIVTGLTGQTVGSRVVLVIPPAQGYPNGNASPQVDKTDTLVVLVDLLFTQSQ